MDFAGAAGHYQPPQPTGVFNFNTLFRTSRCIVREMRWPVSCWSSEYFLDRLQQKVCGPERTSRSISFRHWKATRNLTVNAGLRYTLNFPRLKSTTRVHFNLATQHWITSERMDSLIRAGSFTRLTLVHGWGWPID